MKKSTATKAAVELREPETANCMELHFVISTARNEWKSIQLYCFASISILDHTIIGLTNTLIYILRWHVFFDGGNQTWLSSIEIKFNE